jgi:hypothetical protein
VLTVNGLVVLAPLFPNVVVQVLPTFGMMARKPAQLPAATTPTLTATVSRVKPDPPVQYMVKDHTPALTVCAGRFVKPHTLVDPSDATEQGVARTPTV